MAAGGKQFGMTFADWTVWFGSTSGSKLYRDCDCGGGPKDPGLQGTSVDRLCECGRIDCMDRCCTRAGLWYVLVGMLCECGLKECEDLCCTSVGAHCGLGSAMLTGRCG